MLRVPAGTPPADWRPALQDLNRRGATVALQVTGVPDAADPLLGLERTAVIVDVRETSGVADGAALDELVLRLKRAVAVVRGGEASGVEIVARPSLANALQSRGFAEFGVTIRGAGDDPAARRLRDVLFDRTRDVWRLPGDPVAANALVGNLVRVLPWLPEMAQYGTMSCGGVTVPAYVDFSTMQIVGVSEQCPRDASITPPQPGSTVQRLDIDGVSLLRVVTATGDRFVENVGVAAAASLTAEEIVARHQSQAARQAARVSTLISAGTLTLTFEAPGFVAPLTVTSHTVIFTGPDRTDLQQQEIRVNGVAFTANGGVPRLPIIEPERAAAPPLAITLNELYRYRLEGRDTIDGHACYVIAFAPRDRRASLHAGRAWIAADSFAMVRVSAAQTGLRGPITVSEQTDEFRDAGDGVWLLARSEISQTYEGASVRTPIHRLVLLDSHEVNAPDFEARRRAAYASPDVMLRDTPQGYRYLTTNKGSGTTHDETPANSDARVVAGRADRVRTLAFGVIVDPNISRPLPFAGISYVDFNLFGTGTQFSGFFGGAFGQLAFSVPSVAGSRWQVAGRAFGIAAAYNDRTFELGHEQYERDIRQRPAQASVWALRPLSPRVSVRLGYDWDYTKLFAADVTAPEFIVPANQVVHGARLGLDLQRAGWQASVWWNPARRAGWRPWGMPGNAEYQPTQRDFQRYGVSVLRSVAITPRVVTRVEGAWMAGDDLDRFSRYSFGSFDNRLHGYPSALIRYDRGAVLRTAVAWSAAKALRIDGFADTAQVHDPGFGTAFRNFTGFGAAVEAPAPFGTLLAVEWGYGVQGIDSDGQRGTHVVRISGYKVF